MSVQILHLQQSLELWAVKEESSDCRSQNLKLRILDDRMQHLKIGQVGRSGK